MRSLVFVAFALVACQSADQSSPPPPAPTPKLEMIDAQPTPTGQSVAPQIAREYQRAKTDGKKLVVYVGAVWCEPCQRFHEAAAAGKLDAMFGGVRMLVFDNDRDGETMVGAGYSSQMIPLFVLPNADGTSSKRQIEGSIKGADAVQQIAPRLKQLLAGA
jgi:thiol-disulfide isomerase/thioredoxin